MSLLSLLVLGGPAYGADCESGYGLDTLADDLGVVESAVRSDESEAAAQAARRLLDGLPCLSEPLPRVVAGRAYRAVATGLLSTEEAEQASRWYRTAAVVDGSFLYSLEDLPEEDHPAFEGWRLAVEAAKGADSVPIEGHVWSSGTFTLDGRRLNWPAAEPDMPHLLQRSLDGETDTWLVDGTDFPSEALIADASVRNQANASDGPSPVTHTVPTVTVQQVGGNNWPAERVGLVAGGTVALLAGGGLYAMALDKRSQFDASTKRADTTRLAASTNTLTVASTATLAAGAGTLGFGVLFFIVDGNPSPTLDLRF
jgi:hypothetical protein